VLSDIVMPGGMNGIALAQEIGNRYPQIPVVLTSGYSDMAQAAESRFVILRKPFQLPALDKSIREALEHGGTRDDGGRVVQFSQERGAPRRRSLARLGFEFYFTLWLFGLGARPSPRRAFEIQKIAIRGLGWEEYVTPGIEADAQTVINQQLLKEYDILSRLTSSVHAHPAIS